MIASLRRVMVALRLCVAFALFAPGLVPAAGGAETEARSILLIYGEAGPVPAIASFDRGIRSVLQSGLAAPLRFYTESLDSSWSSDKPLEDALAELLARKFAGRKIDLIVACGDSAIQFTFQHRGRLFLGVPVVFCGATPAILEASLPPDVTGVTMVFDWGGAVGLALRLHPETERVVYIGGASGVARGYEAQARQAFARYEGRVQFEYLTELPMPEILDRVRSLPERTVILHGFILRDAAGATFTGPEGLALVSGVSGRPIYSVAGSLLGHGIVGGPLVDFEAHGALAGELALRVLRGERLGPADVVRGTNSYAFDARQLARFRIDERRLPTRSVVRFRPEPVWRRYLWPIIGGLALITVQALLIGGMLVERRQRARAQRTLAEQLRFEKLIGNLLAELSALTPEEVDRRIDSSLGLIVQALGVDRAEMARIDDGERLTVGHVAVRSDVRPVSPGTATVRIPWMVERLRRGQVVALSRLDELPPEATADREGLLASGVRSIVFVPLAVGREIAGALSLRSVRSERAWPDDLVERLRLVGEIFADAMAQQRANRAVRESEDRFRLMAEAAPMMIWMSGPDARCIYFNKRWLRFTGRLLEEELGDGWTAGVHPDDLRSCLAGYLRAFDAREEFTLEYRLRDADGAYRCVLDHGAPRIEADGTFRGYIGSCIDTTDLKVAQEALLESTRLQSAVFGSFQGRLAAIDRDGVIVAANEVWTRFATDHGLDLGIGANYLDACRKAASGGDPHHASVLDAIESVLQGRSRRVSLEYPDAGGDRWYEMTVEPFQRPAGGAIVLHVDITRRRQAEDEAHRQRDELARVLRAATMGELSGALAHEINQPLAAILTNARVARRIVEASGQEPEDLQETLADIADDAKRAADIIVRLRAMYGKEAAKREPVDINRLVMDVAGLLHRDAQRRGVVIALSLRPSLPPVSGDPVQLQQVVLNLLLNAADAVTTGGGAGRQITLATGQLDPDTVEVSVSDTGIGVSEADLEHIFAPFVSTKRGGLGMGLSISRSIVAAHGGRIWATRNPERGITVHVQLPCGVANASLEPGMSGRRVGPPE